MQNLLEGICALEKQAIKLVDHDQILNAFYRYIHYYGELHITGVMEQFADRPDISLEIGEEGIYEGRETIQAYFGFMPKLAQKPGILIYHYTDTPVVEIAKDGQSAKLTALAPGLDAAAKALVQNWVYGKYYADLVKENGAWKLYHVQWFRDFECSMTKGWMKEQTAHDRELVALELKDAYEKLPRPKESSYPENWAYPKHYDPERVNYLMPEPPQPFNTYDGKTAMTKTREY